MYFLIIFIHFHINTGRAVAWHWECLLSAHCTMVMLSSHAKVLARASLFWTHIVNALSFCCCAARAFLKFFSFICIFHSKCGYFVSIFQHCHFSIIIISIQFAVHSKSQYFDYFLLGLSAQIPSAHKTNSAMFFLRSRLSFDSTISGHFALTFADGFFFAQFGDYLCGEVDLCCVCVAEIESNKSLFAASRWQMIILCTHAFYLCWLSKWQIELYGDCVCVCSMCVRERERETDISGHRLFARNLNDAKLFPPSMGDQNKRVEICCECHIGSVTTTRS